MQSDRAGQNRKDIRHHFLSYNLFICQTTNLAHSRLILLLFTGPQRTTSYSNMYFNATSRPKPPCLHDRLSREYNNVGGPVY